MDYTALANNDEQRIGLQSKGSNVISTEYTNAVGDVGVKAEKDLHTYLQKEIKTFLEKEVKSYLEKPKVLTELVSCMSVKLPGPVAIREAQGLPLQ